MKLITVESTVKRSKLVEMPKHEDIVLTRLRYDFANELLKHLSQQDTIKKTVSKKEQYPVGSRLDLQFVMEGFFATKGEIHALYEKINELITGDPALRYQGLIDLRNLLLSMEQKGTEG